MSQKLKVLGVEQSCNTTANTYGNNQLVRVVHIGLASAGHLVTCKYANGDVKYTVTIAGGDSLILSKGFTDTLQSNAADTSVLAVPVAYFSQ